MQLCRSLNILWHLPFFHRTFSSPMATAEFSRFAGILSAVLSQRHPSEFEILSKRTQITDVGKDVNNDHCTLLVRM